VERLFACRCDGLDLVVCLLVVNLINQLAERPRLAPKGINSHTTPQSIRPLERNRERVDVPTTPGPSNTMSLPYILYTLKF
jgi:hypothetical protein